MVKQIGVFQKKKKKQNDVKLFKIFQDRSKTNIFVSNCVENKKNKKRNLVFFEEKNEENKYNRSSTIKDLPSLERMNQIRTLGNTHLP